MEKNTAAATPLAARALMLVVMKAASPRRLVVIVSQIAIHGKHAAAEVREALSAPPRTNSGRRGNVCTSTTSPLDN